MALVFHHIIIDEMSAQVFAEELRLAPAAELHGVSVWELFGSTAAAAPEREAVVAPGERLAFAELADRARTMSAVLRAHGVRTGTMVGFCLPRRSDLLVAMLATWGAGFRVDPAVIAPRGV